MLVIRRVIYFSINISLAVLALILIEGVVAYIKQSFWIYSPQFKAGPDSKASRAYMIVLPLIMALFDSRLMKRGFVAGRWTDCEIISPMSYNLSFLGCYLRVCFFFLPALTYFSLLSHFRPYRIPNIRDLLSTQIIDATFLCVILFIPLSVLINRGHQGIHDYMLNILFQRKNSAVNFHINIIRTLLLTTVATVLTSILLYMVIINSSYYKTYMYYINVASERLPELSLWQHANDENMYNLEKLKDSLSIRLKQSLVGNEMLGIDFQVEENNGEQYTVIDIATHANLDDENTIYMIAYEVAQQLEAHEQAIEKFRVKLSKRFLFDLVAYERAAIFKVRKMEDVIQVAFDRDSFAFGRGFPVGFPDSLSFLSGD